MEFFLFFRLFCLVFVGGFEFRTVEVGSILGEFFG